MKPFKITLLTAGIIAMLTACNTEPEFQTIYLVRHAEKVVTDTTDNPPLTDEGRQRAAKITEIIDPKTVDRIYTTAYVRNMQTIKPLAEQSGAEVKYYEWHDWQPMLAEIRANSIRLNFVVICGHGDNLLPMIDHLEGAPPMESLGDYEHDKMFRIEMRRDTTLVEVITY